VAAEFVALAELLRAPVARAEAIEAPVTAAVPLEGAPADECSNDVDAALRDARLFRARLADAFDDAAARLLRDLASDVLARELRLAPCDLAELVRRAGERAPAVRVRVAACDVVTLPGVPVVADPALERGDAVVELVAGALDARLGVRLAAVLEVFA
jgi:hypothetical protein